MTTEIPDTRCPVKGCDEQLVLTLTACVPLYTEDPPWPGAGAATYDAADAVSDSWEVECLARHRVWNSVDQIRATNALLPADSDDWTPEDYETAPRFDYAIFAQHALGVSR